MNTVPMRGERPVCSLCPSYFPFSYFGESLSFYIPHPTDTVNTTAAPIFFYLLVVHTYRSL